MSTPQHNPQHDEDRVITDHTIEPDFTSDIPELTGPITDTSDIQTAVETFLEAIEHADNAQEATDIFAAYIDNITHYNLMQYTLRNQIAITNQLNNRKNTRYPDTTVNHWNGFHGWLKHGRHVTKGSTGYTITAPVKAPQCPDCGNAPAYHTNNEHLDCPLAGTDPDTWNINPEQDWAYGPVQYTTATTFADEQTKPTDNTDNPYTAYTRHRKNNTDTHKTHTTNALIHALVNGELEHVPDTVKPTNDQNPQTTLGNYETTNTGFHTLVNTITEHLLNNPDDTRTVLSTPTPRDNTPPIPTGENAVEYIVAKYYDIPAREVNIDIVKWAHPDTPGDLDTIINTIQQTATAVITAINHSIADTNTNVALIADEYDVEHSFALTKTTGGDSP